MNLKINQCIGDGTQKYTHLTMRTQADGRRPDSQRARRGRERGALGLNQGAQLAASVPGSPGLSRWFGTNMVFGHQAQQYRSVYVG